MACSSEGGEEGLYCMINVRNIGKHYGDSGRKYWKGGEEGEGEHWFPFKENRNHVSVGYTWKNLEGVGLAAVGSCR